MVAPMPAAAVPFGVQRLIAVRNGRMRASSSPVYFFGVWPKPQNHTCHSVKLKAKVRVIPPDTPLIVSVYVTCAALLGTVRVIVLDPLPEIEPGANDTVGGVATEVISLRSHTRTAQTHIPVETTQVGEGKRGVRRLVLGRGGRKCSRIEREVLNAERIARARFAGTDPEVTGDPDKVAPLAVICTVDVNDVTVLLFIS
jgi:hypothetical protein